MSQTSITKFFSSECSDSSDSDSRISEYENSCGPEKNIKFYETMLQKEARVKECAKIYINPKGAAECWKFFGNLQINNKKLLHEHKFCKLCFESEITTLKRFGPNTSTTNLTNHLRVCHNIDVKSVTYQKSFISTEKSLTTLSSQKNAFMHARRLCEMCCIDLQPFNIVERQGFQKYVQTLATDVQFPTSTTVATSALNDVYNFYLNNVKKALKKCPKKISLVMDMWTDKYKKISYINIKIHFAEEFNLKSVSLGTEHFPHPHTGKLIAEKISETLKFFALDDREIIAVTDGGANMLSALKIKNITRHPCMAHSLHRFIVQDILNNESFANFQKTIFKLKKIFKALTYRGEELKKLQLLKQQQNVYDLILNIQGINENLDADDNFQSESLETYIEAAAKSPHLLSIKNSVETRWNSILNMIKSIRTNYDVINLLLLNIKKENLLISEMEEELIKELEGFLEVFSEATTYLQGQEYPTISSCIYFFEQIYAKLEVNGNLASFALGIHLYEFAKRNFYKRFQICKIHLLAALMDPAQKTWSKLDVYLKRIPEGKCLPDDFALEFDVESPTTREKFIMTELEHNGIIEIPLAHQEDVEPLQKKPKISASRKIMLEFLASTGNSSIDIMAKEIQNYLSVDVGETESLEWWNENQKLYPRIAKLASICFSIPATSASSEIAFSSAGSCIAEKRSKLNPATVKKQLFVHDNYKLVNSLQQ